MSAFLVLASSAFLLLQKPIRLQLHDFHVILHLVAQHDCTMPAGGLALANENARWDWHMVDCIILA